MHMKTHPQYFISKTRRSSKVGITIGIDLGDIWSHYCDVGVLATVGAAPMAPPELRENLWLGCCFSNSCRQRIE